MSIAGEIILKSLGAWVAIWGFSRLLNAPKKLECYTAGVGMIGWAVYLIVEVLNDGILMKNFLAAVAVALVSQAMARHFKAPVILFVIPGILPMVPGAGMYRIVYSIVMGPENMVGTYLLETATAAGALREYSSCSSSASSWVMLCLVSRPEEELYNVATVPPAATFSPSERERSTVAPPVAAVTALSSRTSRPVASTPTLTVSA